MSNDQVAAINFNKPGAYRGDIVEETFKGFTVAHMPFWWHFREVLRASQREALYWIDSKGLKLPERDQKELVALSLIHYHVYLGLAEAISFFELMGYEVHRTSPHGWRAFETKKFWKAGYSSLYSSFNAICNIVCVVIGGMPVFRQKGSRAWSYSPADARKAAAMLKNADVLEILKNCDKQLEIRNHLDHFWLMWSVINKGIFLIDGNMKKGHIAIHPRQEINYNTDAVVHALNQLQQLAENYDKLYRMLSVTDGHLDQYLLKKGWMVDYSDYAAHDGKRPLP